MHLTIWAVVARRPLPMPCSHQIGEGTAYSESMEGLGLSIAWGMEGELGAAMADLIRVATEARPLWYNFFLKFFSCRSLVI